MSKLTSVLSLSLSSSLSSLEHRLTVWNYDNRNHVNNLRRIIYPQWNKLRLEHKMVWSNDRARAHEHTRLSYHSRSVVFHLFIIKSRLDYALHNRGIFLPHTEMHYPHHHSRTALSYKAANEISSKEFSGEIRLRREKCKRAKAEKRRGRKRKRRQERYSSGLREKLEK